MSDRGSPTTAAAAPVDARARPTAAGPAAATAPRLRRPSVTTRTVPRSALPAPEPLSSALERGCGTVVLVAGSAGTGKTTLLSTWAQSLVDDGHRVGWATLDVDDDDPGCLARTLLDAVVVAGHERRGGAREDGLEDTPQATWSRQLATGRGVDDTSPQALLWATIGQASLDPRATWLLLDDVHTVHDVAALAVLERFLRWLPAHLTVVLASRSEPDVHLARLRLEERLVEVRERQLRFSRSETATLLDLHGLSLEEHEVDRLHELAEGWPAGVALAAVSMTQGRTPASLLHDLERNDRAISSYLVEEVLSSLPDDVRTFLEATSVLEEVTVGAAAAVAERADAGQLLRALAVDSAMVSPILRGDAGVETFRYHALLRSHLRAMLALGGRERLEAAHHRAAHWYADAGEPLRALEHAREAGDADLVSHVLHEDSAHLLAEGHAPSVRRALDALGTRDAFVARVGAVAYGDLGLPDRVRESLAAARSTVAPAAPPGGAAHDASRGPDAGRDERLDRLGRRMLRLISTEAAPASGEAATVPHVTAGLDHEASDLAMLESLAGARECLAGGRVRSAITAYSDALRAAEATDHELVALQAMSGLATACAADEDPASSRRWAEEVVRRASVTPWHASPRLLASFVLSAWAAFEALDDAEARRRNDAARRVLDEAVSAVPERSGPHPDSVFRRGLDQLGRLITLLDDYLEVVSPEPAPGARRAAAAAALERVRPAPGQSLSTPTAVGELVTAHRLQLHAGALPAAREIEQLCRGVLPPERHRLLTALRELHAGDVEAAGAAVTTVAAAPVVTGSPHASVVADLVLAVVACHAQRPVAAHERLSRAVATADAHGLARTVVEVPGVPDLLLLGAGRFGTHEAFASAVLAAARRASPTAPPTHAPLTSRELTLLADLPSLLTVKEIAQLRSVSPNTVKTQLRSIFEKLGVSSRRDAVGAARRLGLL